MSGIMVQDIAITAIKASATNPRKEFSAEDQAELTASIKEKGIQDPIQVRPGKSGNSFEIIDGERRWRAATGLKREFIPCIVTEMSDEEAVQAQLTSHLQRKNIHPMEEAEAYSNYFGKLERDNQARRKAIKELAQTIGKDESHVTQRLQLLKLIKVARDIYSKDIIGIEHATLIAKMIPEDQERALNFLVGYNPALRQDYKTETPPNIHLFKKWIEQEISMNLQAAPFDKSDDALIPGVPACILCPKNSGFNTALFPELSKHHMCGDRVCFKAKVAAHLHREKERVRKEEKRGFIMVSTTQLDMDDPLKVDGVKMKGRYKIVREGNECEETKRAQWIDGADKGKFILVCNYSKCKKHFKGSNFRGLSTGEDYNSPKNQLKRRRAKNTENLNAVKETIFRRLVVSEGVKKLQKETDLAFARRLVEKVIDGSHLRSLYHIFLSRTTGDEKPTQEALTAMVRKMSGSELQAVFFEIDHDGWFHPFNITETRKEVKAEIKRLKLSEAKLNAKVEDIIATELHLCEVCGCTEKTACDGGCQWDETFLKAERYVCSQCPDKVTPIKQPTAGRAKATQDDK